MITNTGNVNSLINSYLNTNKNDINTYKSANQIKYSEDSYVPSTKFVASLGVYSKEDMVEKNENVKKEEFSDEEYTTYCELISFGTLAGTWDNVYYPPPNAPYEVKKAWIETMKSLTSEEQHLVRESVLNSVRSALSKYDSTQITAELYQNYLNNNFASYEGLVGLFTENFIDSKDKQYDQFMENILNTFKTNYEKYSEK